MNTVNYLGVTIDRNLTWVHNIKERSGKAIKASFALRCLANKNWGLDHNKIRWIIKSIIQPIVTYGAIVWADPGRDINFNKVARPLLMSCGSFFRTTPTEALWTLLDITPFEILARVLAVKARIRTSPQLPLKWDGIGNPGRGHQRKLDLIHSNRTLDDINLWGHKLWSDRWTKAEAKNFISDIGAEWYNHLSKLSRHDLRTVVGFITGHWKFNKHLNRLGLTDSSTCRFCQESEEDSFHLIWQCPTFEQRRVQDLEKYNWFIGLAISIGNQMN